MSWGDQFQCPAPSFWRLDFYNTSRLWSRISNVDISSQLMAFPLNAFNFQKTNKCSSTDVLSSHMAFLWSLAQVHVRLPSYSQLFLYTLLFLYIATFLNIVWGFPNLFFLSSHVLTDSCSKQNGKVTSTLGSGLQYHRGVLYLSLLFLVIFSWQSCFFGFFKLLDLLPGAMLTRDL